MLQGQPGMLQGCSKGPAIPHCQRSPISMSTGFRVRVPARKQIRARRQMALEPPRWQFRRVTLTAAGSTDIHADTWMILRDLRDTVTHGISSGSCGDRDTRPALAWILSQGKLRHGEPWEEPGSTPGSHKRKLRRGVPIPQNVPMSQMSLFPGCPCPLGVPVPDSVTSTHRSTTAAPCAPTATSTSPSPSMSARPSTLIPKYRRLHPSAAASMRWERALWHRHWLVQGCAHGNRDTQPLPAPSHLLVLGQEGARGDVEHVESPAVPVLQRSSHHDPSQPVLAQVRHRAQGGAESGILQPRLRVQRPRGAQAVLGGAGGPSVPPQDRHPFNPTVFPRSPQSLSSLQSLCSSQSTAPSPPRSPVHPSPAPLSPAPSPAPLRTATPARHTPALSPAPHGTQRPSPSPCSGPPGRWVLPPTAGRCPHLPPGPGPRPRCRSRSRSKGARGCEAEEGVGGPNSPPPPRPSRSPASPHLLPH